MFDIRDYVNKLEKIRQSNHWSITDLCEKISINPLTYRRMRNPEKGSYFKTLRKVKKFIEDNEKVQ